MEDVLAKKYKIQGLPALIYFKDGKQLEKMYGVKSPKKLKELEEKHFN